MPVSPGRCPGLVYFSPSGWGVVPGRCPGLACFSPSGWGGFWFAGLKGRHKPAQGNALGQRGLPGLALKGRKNSIDDETSPSQDGEGLGPVVPAPNPMGGRQGRSLGRMGRMDALRTFFLRERPGRANSLGIGRPIRQNETNGVSRRSAASSCSSHPGTPSCPCSATSWRY